MSGATAGYVDRDGDGVREAGGVPMAPVLLVQANNLTRVRAAELIAAAVKGIGIDARVRVLEAGSVTGRVWPDLDVSRRRDYDWTMFGWAAPQLVDPLRIVALVDSDVRYGTNNIGGYRSAEADALAARLRGTLDLAVQRDLLQQLGRVIARDRPFVMLWYPDLTYAYHPAALGLDALLRAGPPRLPERHLAVVGGAARADDHRLGARLRVPRCRARRLVAPVAAGRPASDPHCRGSALVPLRAAARSS